VRFTPYALNFKPEAIHPYNTNTRTFCEGDLGPQTWQKRSNQEPPPPTRPLSLSLARSLSRSHSLSRSPTLSRSLSFPTLVHIPSDTLAPKPCRRMHLKNRNQNYDPLNPKRISPEAWGSQTWQEWSNDSTKSSGRRSFMYKSVN
jgi:hypothetical protein